MEEEEEDKVVDLDRRVAAFWILDATVLKKLRLEEEDELGRC